MLLSRVAESVYWSGRYLERAEGTARMIKIHTELFLDLPRSAGIGWSPLLAITGSTADFDDHYGQRDAHGNTAEASGPVHLPASGSAAEEDVIRFLATDPNNPASIISSLSAARANFRVTRAVFPGSSWEILNALFLWNVEARTLAVDRRTRLAWMDRVIRDCQTLRGLLSSTMSHDAAYSFLEIGRAIEIADLTTRVLDVQAGVLMSSPGAMGAARYSDITWMSVLKSLAAHQMFRRTVRGGVSGPEALRFLLRDPQFPRSVEHSLTRISRSLLELPRYDEAMAGCAEVQKMLVDADVADLAMSGLHEYVDEVQLGIAALHEALTTTYFVRAAPAEPEHALTTLLASA